MRFIIAMAAAFALFGCATKYQEMGFTGGVAAQQVTADTWRIVARGTAYNGGTRVEDFYLMKAAETTKAAGGTHFVIGGSQDASSQGTIVTPGSAQTTFMRSSAYTTFSPRSVHTYIKPGQDAYIRVLTVPAGKPPPAGAISADEIIQFIGPRLRS